MLSSTRMALHIWLDAKYREYYVQLAYTCLPTHSNTQEIETFIRLVPIFHTRYPETRELTRFIPGILAIQKGYPEVTCSKMCDAFREHRADVQAIQFVNRTWLSEDEKLAMFRERISNTYIQR
jgi:hypothetical protein